MGYILPTLTNKKSSTGLLVKTEIKGSLLTIRLSKSYKIGQLFHSTVHPAPQ